MSKYYGQVSGSSNTTASRRGFTEIMASVQSYDGSVITRLYDNRDGEMRLEVSIADDSSMWGVTVYQGTIEHFKEILKKAQEERQ